MFIHTIILLFGGICLNLLQYIISYVPSNFLSHRKKIEWNQYLGGFFWDSLYGLLELSNVQIIFSGMPIPTQKENTIMICNHLASLDFLAKMAVVLRMGFSGGNILTIMKKTVKYIPVIGWTPYLQGGLLLNRNWNEDKEQLSKKFKQLNEPDEYPQPYLFGMYPEGTRKTVEKLMDAQYFEESRGLPILHNVLCPRTKGFVCLVQHLRQSCKRIVDLTIDYEPNTLNALDIFFKQGFQTRRIYIHVDVLEMSQLPEEEKELEQWLYKQFQKKDEWLSERKRTYSDDMSSYKSSIPLNTWFYPFVGFHLFFVYMLKVLFGGWIGNVAAMIIIYSYLSLTTQINDWLRNILIRWLSSKEQHLINLTKLD